MTRRPRCRHQHGSATMWLVSMIAVLGAVTLVLVHVGAALVERRHAQSAADLAALAGATALQDGRGGCDRAAAVARRNGAELVSCAITDRRVTVRVHRSLELPILGGLPVTGRARAGPAGALGDDDYPGTGG